MTSFKGRLIVSFCSVLTAVTLLVTAAVYSTVNHEVQVSAQKASQLVLENFETTLKSKQALLEQGIGFLVERPGTIAIGDADTLTINDHLKQIKGTTNADWLCFFDRTGAVNGSTIETSSLEKPISTLNVAAQAIEKHSWTGLLNVDGKHFLVVAKPITVGGFTKGALAGGTALDDSLAQSISKSLGAEVVAFGNDGVIASSTAADLPRPEQGDVIRTKIGNSTYVGETKSLSVGTQGQNIRLTTYVKRANVAQPFSTILGALALGFLVALGISMLASVRIAGKMAQPIVQLTHFANDLEVGNWPAPLPTHRSDEFGRLMGTFNNMVTSLKDQQAQLLTMLDVDPLTQLWNTRSFQDKLTLALANYQQEGTQTSLVMVDIDRFASYNAKFGNQAGDDLLIKIAELMNSLVGAKGNCARQGHDLFLMLVPSHRASEYAETLRQQIEQLEVTASLGIAPISELNQRGDLWMLSAKLAVDTAKQAGRNRVRFFETFSASATDDTDLKQLAQNSGYATIRALAQAVDAKDEYTRGHSMRVAEYARDIAKHLNLDAGFIELIYVSGTLHDVGKIGVPDLVLKKEGKLTDEEFAEIKRHPELGERIVAQVPILRDTLPGIRSHHERWDGRGYPDGLAGENIPLIARIMAIADTYDAMTSDRPYRKGMPVEVAIEAIVNGAGTQFDPELIPAFLKWIEESGIRPQNDTLAA